MKTVVIYYSLTGKTDKIAKEKAIELGAELIEIKEEKKRSILSAYVFGAYSAMKQKKANIQNIKCKFTDYDKIVIAMPIWGGFPAPPFNNVVEKLPKGKDVELVMTSGSGNSSKTKEKSIAKIKGKGCNVVGYIDIKTYKK